jgi:hypothetical protein
MFVIKPPATDYVSPGENTNPGCTNTNCPCSN